jgi:hypothetical protein
MDTITYTPVSPTLTPTKKVHMDQCLLIAANLFLEAAAALAVISLKTPTKLAVEPVINLIDD